MCNTDVDGMTCWASSQGMAETTRRLRDAIAENGMTLFAHIDHGRGAKEAAVELAPMEVFMFGSAAAGTRLMRTAPTAGIDLPLRVLVWVDEDGGTWLGYNEPSWIAARHRARSGNDQVLAAMRGLLRSIAEQVTGLGAGS